MTRTALLIEDDALSGILLGDMLAALGYQVLGPYGRARDAFDAIETKRFEVAVLDVNLGGERCLAIGDRLDARGIPYLYTTGYSERDLALPEGHAPVLTKPFTQGRLASVLEALV